MEIFILAAVLIVSIATVDIDKPKSAKVKKK